VGASRVFLGLVHEHVGTAGPGVRIVDEVNYGAAAVVENDDRLDVVPVGRLDPKCR
jgi:hypothetical protein